MILTTILTVFLCIGHTTAGSGYGSCKSGKHILLEQELRCVEVLGDTYLTRNWDEAMDACLARQGRLLHVYTSTEMEKLKAFLMMLDLPKHGLIGHKKFPPLLNNFTGYNMRWMVSKTEDIGIEMSYQFVPLKWTPWQKNDGAKHGSMYTCGPSYTCYNEPNLGWPSLSKDFPANAHFPICEYLNPAPVKNFCFSPYFAKRSPGPVYEKFNTYSKTTCAKACSRQPHCQGFNLIGQTSDAVCELLAIQHYDTPTGTLVDDISSNYFARKE